MRLPSRRVPAMLVAFVMLGCTTLLGAGAGIAKAEPFADVVAAIKNQTRLIDSSPGAATERHLTLSSAAEARSALPSLIRLHATLAYAAADVSHASTQSPVQRAAKRAWVSGTRDEALAIAQLEAAARALAVGHRTQIRPHLSRALGLILVGAQKTSKADALLDLAHNGRAPKLHLSGS